jgi:hypothetical protein
MALLRARIEKLLKSDMVLFALVTLGIMTRTINLHQSLFVDEAWANSVLTESLHEMLYYDNWLQTSPPLFLLLVRYTAHRYRRPGLADFQPSQAQ